MDKFTFPDIIAENGLFIDGDWVESKDQDKNGDVRLIQLADIGDGYFVDKSNRYLTSQKAKDLKCTYLRKGDILLARMPDPLGRACIFPGLEMPCVTVVDVCIIRPNPIIVDSAYLKYLINSPDFRKKIQKYITGTTRQRISRGNLSKINFYLPPLEEQHRIVKNLDLAQSLIEKRKQAIAYLDEYIKAVFLDMFGDPVSNPKGWEVKTVEQIAVKDKNGIKAGPFGSSLKKEFYVKSGYKIYGQEQVIKNDFAYGDYYIDENRYNSLSSCKIQSGDILISLVGSFGKISIVPDKFEPGIINPRLMKITPDQKIISPVFLKELLISNSVQSQIKNVSHGGTMGIVNVGIMKKIKILVPPLPYQLNYLKVKSKTETLKQKMQAQLKELEDNFQVQLQRAFRG